MNVGQLTLKLDVDIVMVAKLVRDAITTRQINGGNFWLMLASIMDQLK
jgi:hypothetical protein